MIICRVCGNKENNREHRFREQYFGLGDEFAYGECAVCGSLSIADVPEDMTRYYPGSYYSHADRSYNRFSGWLKGRRDHYYLTGTSLIGRLLSLRLPAPSYVDWLRNLQLPFGSTLLEVGSGTGALVVNLQDAGYAATGIDPYVKQAVVYPNGARVRKQLLQDTTGSFDCIMLHHSLEHMAEPGPVFGHLARLLKPDGKLLIRIPVCGTHAWRTYGRNWFQIDAPRHFVLFTEQGLRGLAERSGFRVEQVVYDSTASQFWASEQYVQGIFLAGDRSYAKDPASSIFTPEQIAEYERKARELNSRNDGDQAAFYLTRNG